MSTYENVRQLLLTEFDVKNNFVRSLVGGGCASASSQLILVPFDVISQHMMVLERVKPNRASAPVYNVVAAVSSSEADSLDTLKLAKKLKENPNLRLAPLVCREIYRRDGLIRGFYRGYMASLMCYAPSSALFWAFYHIFSGK